MRSTLILLAVLGLTACSSSSSDNGSSSGSDQGGVPCTIKLTGAVTKTLSCNSTGAFTTNDNVGSLNLTTIGVAAGASDTEATFTFSASGDLTAKTYAWADSKAQEVSVVENNGTWTAEMGKKIGSSSLTITGLTVGGTSAEGKLYEPHGTATATLEGQNGATGTITFSATF